MAKLDWLVVRDMVMIESATWWKDGPEIETGELKTEEIGTEVFFLPAAAHTEKAGSSPTPSGCCSGTIRPSQPGRRCRSDLWFTYHLGRRIRAELAGLLADEADRPVLDLTWDYPTTGTQADPDADAVLAEINGRGPDGPLSSYTQLTDDGATTCRLLDLLRRPGRRRQPGRPPHAVAAAGLGGAGLGLGLAGEPARAVQPGVGRSRRQAVE